MDTRTERTRRALRDALFELAEERGFESVSVSDIAERAHVNRSTFYQHYPDRDTLLAETLDEAAAEAGVNMGVIVEDLEGPAPEPVKAFMRHIAEHRELYRSVIVDPGSPTFLARIRDKFAALIQTAVGMSQASLPAGVPVDVLVSSVAGSIIGMITTWLESHPETGPDEAAEWIWRVALHSPARAE